MKRNFRYMACGIIVTVSLLLTGCNGGAAKPTDPSDALLATETTAATENTKATKPTTKATTPKPTTKPTTSKPTTGKNNTGKTETTKATEAPKPAENQKPAASEPAATQKPSEAPKPTNPPATEAPKPTNPPATEVPKPTDPPETEPPETEPPVTVLDLDAAIEYGRNYISSLGAILDTGLAYDDPGYYPAGVVYTTSQDELNAWVIDAIDSDIANLRARDEGSGFSFELQYYRMDVFVEYEGDNCYAITVYYG